MKQTAKDLLKINAVKLAKRTFYVGQRHQKSDLLRQSFNDQLS